ncbi:MAG: hypothetical protein SCALA702_05530 [Melioribacteraceae bacterium]|nr:MAG: hypothetical protein SCALA702_05530 [Melioribacteraceae bacterium]
MKKLAVIFLIFFITGCSSFNLTDSIKKVKFNLVEVKSIKFCDVDFKDKKKLKDFSLGEIAKISASVIQGKFPGKVTFEVKAVNNSDKPDAFSFADVGIKSFPYTLYLYDKQVVTGNINNPVNFPAPGSSSTFEINADFDMVNMFRELGYEKLIETVLAIRAGDFADISAKITSRPILNVPWGEYEFPEEIKLENKID